MRSLRMKLGGLLLLLAGGALGQQPTAASIVSPASGASLTSTTATFSWHAPDLRAGTLTLPSGFVNMGVTFARDASGNYSTSFNPDSYVASWGITKTIYVDARDGSDSSGGGTEGAPYRTVQKALAMAQAATDTAIQITVVTNGAGPLFTRDQFYPTNANITGKRIYITNDNHAYLTYASTAQTALAWSLVAGGKYTYRAARSAVSSVADMASPDAEGVPSPYRLQVSTANVEASAGSWYSDGRYVYVHTLTGAQPTSKQLVLLALPVFDINLGSNAEVFVRDVCFIGGSHGTQVYNQTGDYTDHKYVEYHTCHSNASSDSLTPANGISVESVKAAQFYQSVFSYNGADGWNLHYTRANPNTSVRRSYYGLCFACSGHDNGLYNSTSLQNSFTSHDGASVAVIDSVGRHNHGPTFAFVGAEDIVLIGDKASDDTSANPTETAEYYADSISAPAGLTPRMYLDGIWGEAPVPGNSVTYELTTDGTVPVTCVYCDLQRVDAATAAKMTVVPTPANVHYQLTVGTTAGGSDISNLDAESASMVTVNNLPADGSTIFVTLSSFIGGSWVAKSYTYRTGVPAAITSPTLGAKMTATSAVFSWNTGAGASAYTITAGPLPATSTYYSLNTGLTTSALVTGLPTDGSRFYITLYTQIGSKRYSNVTYYAAEGTGTAAGMLSPAPGSKLSGADVTFSWSAGTGISSYKLFLGSSPGTKDLSTTTTNATTISMTGLPTDGRTIYATLYSLNGTTWLKNTYTYVASGP